MPKLQVITTNLTAGELTPLLAGRVDIEKWNSSAKQLLNCVILKQGGATIRPPLVFKRSTKLAATKSRLIPFVYSRTDAFNLEFGQNYFRVQRADGTLVESSPGVPLEVATPYTAAEVFEMDFSQGSDTMILTHGDRYPMRVRRFPGDLWTIDAAPFIPSAVSEVGNQQFNTTMTISNGTVGAGRTITSSIAYFLASDVGREITWGGGVAVITAVGSATSATATVTTAFGALTGYYDRNLGQVWTMLGSPLTTATPSLATPLGAAVTVTLGAAGWRDDIGSVVQINGGLIRITGIASTTVANGVIVQELTSTVAAVADGWSLLRNIWTEGMGYPQTCCFYQQRLWFSNTRSYPQSLWGSRTGLYYDFTPGTDDDSGVYKTIAATDEVNPIQFLCGAGSLIMLGYGAEIEGKGGVEKPITQNNMQINAQSEWGAARVRPVTVGKEILWVEAGGTAIRALFPQQVDGYDSTDVSVYSEHLLRAGVSCITYERKPNSVVWVATTDGALHALTYNREQNTIGFCSGQTDGVVESLSTIPTATGSVTDAVVARVVNGQTVRYVERLDWGVERGFFDCRLTATSVTPSLAFTGFGAMQGRELDVVADGQPIGKFTVGAGGTLTLPVEASSVVAGLAYPARIVLPPPEVGTGTGTSTGQATSISQTQVRVHETIGLVVNGEDVPFRNFDTTLLDTQIEPFTGIKSSTGMGWGTDSENDLVLEQLQGLPFTVLSIVRTITVNAG